MAAGPNRIRFVLLVACAAIAVTLGALHLRYPLPYVYAVVVHQDPDFDDIHRFPSRPIASAEAASGLPVAIDPAAAKLLELHPGVGELGRFLDQTETSAFLVLHRGRVVLQRYTGEYGPGSLQNGFSIAKSVTSALVGLAVHDGAIEYDAPVTRYLPELADREQRFDRITVEYLLDMRSGIRYSKTIAFPFFTADNALIYYHGDLESVVLERTSIASEPGTFQYNNYNPPLLGIILRRTTGLPVATYAERELWQPLGAEGAAGWTVDGRGFERMESGFFARARDLARFGQLYLDGGRAQGRSVLPAAWVARSTGLSEPLRLDAYDGRTWSYRAGWWIVPRPEGPADFAAIGHFGQFVYVSPQHDAVFVRCGPGRGEWGDGDWTALFYATAERLGASSGG